MLESHIPGCRFSLLVCYPQLVVLSNYYIVIQFTQTHLPTPDLDCLNLGKWAMDTDGCQVSNYGVSTVHI